MPHPASILPSSYRPPSREQIERARAMYTQGFTVSRILAACDMALGTLYYWLDGGPQEASGPPSLSSLTTSGRPDVIGGPAENISAGPTTDQSAVGSGPLYPPIPRRRAVVGKRRKPLAADRVSLTARLWRTAERLTRDIEERLARPAAATPERERDVRMLSVLVRTLRDLSLFDAADPRGQGSAPEAPLDVDALRASLIRKLDALVAEQQAQEGG